MTVCGWVAKRREHGEHLAFIDLRDHTGIVQCVIPGTVDVRSEFVLAVDRTVRPRPEGTANPDLPTGQVEVGDCTVTVLNPAEPPPFAVDDRVEVEETTRLRFRYIDLRRPRMQTNLRLRATVNGALRAAMDSQGFVEVETPLLWSPTPEGAREFVVPSRLSPGSCYVLPQSPQLAKQLLMVAGVDRYYQIARCLRDEDLRADRQFEFSQLDVEASFVDQEDVLEFVSEAVLDAAEAVTGERPPDIPRMTWAEAIDRYGSDKPDVRFGMELIDLTAVFEGTGVKAFAAPCVKASVVAGGGGLSRSRLDGLTDRARQLGAKGLAWFRVGEPDQGARVGLDSPLARFLSDDEQAGLLSATGATGRRPDPGGGRRVPVGLHRPRPAAARDRGPPGQRGPLPLSVGGRFPHVRRRRRRRPPGAGPPSLHHAPSRGSRPPRVRPGLGASPRPTTWCSTGGSSGRAASGSTGPTSRAGSSPFSGSPRRRPSRASGSCSVPSATALRPTPASPWASTGWWPSSPARTASARSSPSPRPNPGRIPMTGAPKPVAPGVLADLGLRPVPPKE